MGDLRHSIRRPASCFAITGARADFPWVSLWEENRSRMFPPWNGQAITRGIEFGVSPFAEGRRAMVERGRCSDSQRIDGWGRGRA